MKHRTIGVFLQPTQRIVCEDGTKELGEDQVINHSEDIIQQPKLLTYVAREIDVSRIRTALEMVIGPNNLENIRAAQPSSKLAQHRARW